MQPRLAPFGQSGLTNGSFACVADDMAKMVPAPDTMVTHRARSPRFHARASADLKDLVTGRQTPSRFIVYAMGTITGASRSGSADLRGFDHHSGYGTARIVYRTSPGLIVGLAGNDTTTNADLNRVPA